MDNTVVLTVGVGLAALLVGTLLGYLLGRTGSTTPSAAGAATNPADNAVLQQALASREAALAQAAAVSAERDRALTEATALRDRLGTAERLVAAADARSAAERAAAEQRMADLQQSQAQLAEQFTALSAEALKANNEQFLAVAEQRLKATQSEQTAEFAKREKAVETMVAPLKETLGKVDEQLRALEVERGKAYAELRQQVSDVQSNSRQLKDETASLVKALRAPQARGRWGELQLRRIVEIAGMASRCDFTEQTTVDTVDGKQRPDMVVTLAGGKSIVVDSKVTLAAYLDAYESIDELTIDARMQAHARHMRDHVNTLAAKTYWTQFTPSPEFVVLFVPGEAFLAPALERDPTLLEDAMAKKVIIATPTTLMSMLKTVAYSWQQEALTQNAQRVLDLGKELYERLGTLGGQVAKLGRSIESVANDYNKAVGSLESRVLVTARRLNDLELVSGDLEEPRNVEGSIRTLSKPELVAADEAARPVQLLPTPEDSAPESISLAEPLGTDEPLRGHGASGG